MSVIGWLPVGSQKVPEFLGYIPIRLRERQVFEGDKIPKEALLSLSQIAYDRAKEMKGNRRVNMRNYFIQLEAVADLVADYIKCGETGEPRITSVAKYYDIARYTK